VAKFQSTDNQAWISVHDDDSGTYGALFGTDTDAGHDIVLADKSATKRLVINSSGHVGIGTTSPARNLQIGDGTGNQVFATATDGQIGIGPSIYLYNPANTNAGVGGQIVFGMRSTEEQVRIVATGGTGESLRFVLADVERFHFDNTGRITFGTGTTYSTNGKLLVPVDGSSFGAWVSRAGTSSTRKHLRFENTNGEVGWIQSSSSSVAISSVSDYRLKENAAGISDGITRLKTLKPYRFNFKTDSSTTVDGFFAHEVMQRLIKVLFLIDLSLDILDR
jgi:hypothetical protein